ncbi:peptidoglycan DD-metalloendopeptidase family protein [candidate division WWE3 bacterium]|nr:peptidoglycan DD-metalloendopeptidase family protein [candidate division WWE3 bacterium]
MQTSFCYHQLMKKVIVKYPVDVEKFPMIQDFGTDNSEHPIRKDFYKLFDNKHPGVDFATPLKTPVKAAFKGIVVRKEFHKGMGNVLGVRYCNIVALYAHLSEFKASLGEIVDSGQLLGLSGDTGAACTKPHLHFELRDISKSPLKNMVFDPPFGKSLENLQETFVYKVNNKNTKKTLQLLALRYFGNESYWKLLRDFNSLTASPLEVLEQGLEVIIPNFE